MAGRIAVRMLLPYRERIAIARVPRVAAQGGLTLGYIICPRWGRRRMRSRMIEFFSPAKALDPARADRASFCLLAVEHSAGECEAALPTHLTLDRTMIRAAVFEIESLGRLDDQLVVRHRRSRKVRSCRFVRVRGYRLTALESRNHEIHERTRKRISRKARKGRKGSERNTTPRLKPHPS